MKYLVNEIQTSASGTISTLNYSYDDRNAAESQYHTILASAAISELPAHAAVLMTSEGMTLMHAVYHHALPEPEPEPENDGE